MEMTLHSEIVHNGLLFCVFAAPVTKELVVSGQPPEGLVLYFVVLCLEEEGTHLVRVCSSPSEAESFVASWKRVSRSGLL